MDAAAFDRLSRTLFRAASRRATLGALVAAAALGRASLPAGAQGCLVNGTRCHTGEECCSGLCKRRNNGKKVCKQAGNQGECTIEENLCPEGLSIQCGVNNTGTVGCRCFVTASGRSFCGANNGIQSVDDCDCASNKECERRVGKGAKCIQVDDPCRGQCPPGTTSGCMAPCENLDPVP